MSGPVLFVSRNIWQHIFSAGCQNKLSAREGLVGAIGSCEAHVSRRNLRLCDSYDVGLLELDGRVFLHLCVGNAAEFCWVGSILTEVVSLEVSLSFEEILTLLRTVCMAVTPALRNMPESNTIADRHTRPSASAADSPAGPAPTMRESKSMLSASRSLVLSFILEGDMVQELGCCGRNLCLNGNCAYSQQYSLEKTRERCRKVSVNNSPSGSFGQQRSHCMMQICEVVEA